MGVPGVTGKGTRTHVHLATLWFFFLKTVCGYMMANDTCSSSPPLRGSAIRSVHALERTHSGQYPVQ